VILGPVRVRLSFWNRWWSAHIEKKRKKCNNYYFGLTLSLESTFTYEI
jgi:hypothetical protein